MLALLSRSSARLFAAGATLALLLTSAAADTPALGYQLAAQPSPAPFASTCTLPGGDIVTFDGLSVDRWTSAGAFVGTLATLPSFTFASFVVPTPAGDAVVIGESSNGDLFLVQSDGSGTTPLVSLTFNFDADWLPNGDLLVSAATGGFGAGNDFVRVVLNPPSATFIGHVDGPSGPLAVAANGDVFYATQVDPFPPPLGSTDVVRWTAANVLAGNLSALNAVTLAAGFNGGSSVAIDPVGGKLYLAETSFSLSEYRIREVGSSVASSPIVVDQGAGYLDGLEFVPGTSAGSFAAWQPATGVNLKYNEGSGQFTVRPLRPVLTISGPGTTGPGAVVFDVTGGVPNGIMLAAACPIAFVGPTEIGYAMPTFLFVSPFTLSETRRASATTPIFLDASGTGSFQIMNPGSLVAAMGWQFMLGDASGVLVASSNAATF